MERLAPYLLLLVALGLAYLGIGGLVRLRPERPEFWLLGLGVRSRVGAIKVLVVAALLFLLGYSVLRRGSIQRVLDPSQTISEEQFQSQRVELSRAKEQIEEYRNQISALSREKEACQEIVSRQGQGMAKTGDAAAELQANLSLRQREIAGLQSSLAKANEELAAMKNENERLVQAASSTKEQVEKLESRLDIMQNEKTSLALKLEAAAKASDSENSRLKEENSKLKAQYREQDRRARLLRQGLVLREANDWALEQEIQRLANLLSDQPEVNTPRQTDIARSLQKINQVLREGQELTKQAKVADSQSDPQKPVAVPGKTK
jgi:chromosome segregation ATPase